MTESEVYGMIYRMKEYGGSFVVALAEAIRMADRTNKKKLIDAFPDYVQQYGPNSSFPGHPSH
jgi:hypothetical protein